MPQHSEELLSVERVAADLRLSRSTVLRKIRLGEIEASKLGDGRTSAYVITAQEIERLKQAAA